MHAPMQRKNSSTRCTTPTRTVTVSAHPSTGRDRRAIGTTLRRWSIATIGATRPRQRSKSRRRVRTLADLGPAWPTDIGQRTDDLGGTTTWRKRAKASADRAASLADSPRSADDGETTHLQAQPQGSICLYGQPVNAGQTVAADARRSRVGSSERARWSRWSWRPVRRFSRWRGTQTPQGQGSVLRRRHSGPEDRTLSDTYRPAETLYPLQPGPMRYGQTVRPWRNPRNGQNRPVTPTRPC